LHLFKQRLDFRRHVTKGDDQEEQADENKRTWMPDTPVKPACSNASSHAVAKRSQAQDVAPGCAGLNP
jgi:hypothetical protein